MLLVAFGLGTLLLVCVALVVLVSMSTNNEGGGSGSGGSGSGGGVSGPVELASTDYKWHDVAGLERVRPLAYPKQGMFDWWNPFAVAGQKVVGGGIENPFGVLPVVNPPAERKQRPYNMETHWQQGPTDVNDYYQKNCRHLLVSPGKLYYKGPHYWMGWGNEGGYIWYARPPKTVRGMATLSTQPFVYTPTVEMLQKMLLTGQELHPWYRRGPMSGNTMKAMQQVCRPGVTPNPMLDYST